MSRPWPVFPLSMPAGQEIQDRRHTQVHSERGVARVICLVTVVMTIDLVRGEVRRMRGLSS